MSQHYESSFFEFLRVLKTHNNREWFQVHKDRYESNVKEPMLRFISDLGKPLASISKNFVADARPVGGSMFRIYQDTRFSKDKTPYKTHVGAQFRHSECGKDVHAPGFYLHLEPGNSMAGGGIWHPDGRVLKKIRDGIVSKSKEWKRIHDAKILAQGDSLKRPPQGYDPSHPYIEDLKQKDFYAMTFFTDKQVCSSGFMEKVVGAYKEAAPLVKFLTKALELPW